VSTNWREIEQRILKVIKTGVRPVAVAFLDAEPCRTPSLMEDSG
jgi:hypothetical protein